MRGTAKVVYVIALVAAGMLAVSTAALAGVIAGSVKDSKTGQPIISADVTVVGTKLGGRTDLDGKYSIANVPPGLHSVRVSYAGYAPKVVTGVSVSGEATAQTDIGMEPMSTERGDAMRIDDMYVTADRFRASTSSMLAERHKSATVADVLSAEQIRLSPDGNSSDALKRVTGLSIVDDKFVFVRGVTDRYNATTLNGIAVTGTDTDADKKSFNFDLLPASLIASTVVAKTASPDLPGDFSGGLVQVNTLDLPEDFLLVANAEMGHDSKSSREEFLKSPGGGSDWKAQDDGSRALPPGLEGNELAQALPNTWGASDDESLMNQSYAVAVGDKYETGAGEFGFVGSGTFKDNFKVEDYHQEPYEIAPDGSRSQLFLLDGTRYKHKYLWGGLFNMTYRPSGSHSFTFENNYNRTAEDKVSQAEGRTELEPVTTQTIEWDQRNLYLGQVAGDHTFAGLGGLEFEWRASYSTSDAQEPDRKFATYSPSARGPLLLKDNYRTWSELGEDARGAKVNVTFPLEVPFGEVKLKAGYLYGKRERSYAVSAFATSVNNVSGPNSYIITLPIDEIFAAENYGPDKLTFIPYSDFTGDYDGTHDLNAYYAMVDSPFRVAGQGFRFAGGARVEDSQQEVESPVSAGSSQIEIATIDEKDVLPSANLTYQLTDASNIRLGYFEAVNRPEFREMANVVYLDLDKSQFVIGNPELERAQIRNYDVRVELFPGVGEVLAASYFYKEMTDAIEETLIPNPGRYVRTWFNSPYCKNYGYEIEMRKSLGFAWRSLEHLYIQGNYTHVDSEVEFTNSYNDPVTNLPVSETKTRPLQGQAPYTVNAGLVYSVPDIGLSMSLLYNRFGRRLEAVGNTPDWDVYEEPRDQVDFALTEQFKPWMRAKFTIKDIIAEDYVETLGGTGSTWESIEAGTTYAISLSFSL